MDKPHLICAQFFCLLCLIAAPSISCAIGVTFLASGWTSSNFLDLSTLNTPYRTRSIEFDTDGNLYIEDPTDDIQLDSSRKIEILKLDASTGYNSSSIFAEYTTDSTSAGVTGLDFDDLGSLYVSERSIDGDAGVIREIDVATKALLGDLMSFGNHRPTGVDADTSGNVYYTGRKESDGTWGNVYVIDSTANRTTLIDSVVGTGIALDASGNIFISTPQRTDLPLLADSIYMFDPNDLLNPILIATFDQRGGELTFDAAGNLYMVAEDQVSIVKLSAVPVPAAFWLFSSGLLGLFGISKSKKAV